jgi:hypothetical protein
VGGAGDIAAALQSVAQHARALRRLILTRRNPDDARKKPLQVERADVHGIAQLRERQALLRIGVEHFARALDDRQFARQARRLAALARTITGALGGIGRREEFDIFPARRPRRARWPAKHAGRAHGKKECAVGLAVAFGHGLPTAFIGREVCDVHIDLGGLLMRPL